MSDMEVMRCPYCGGRAYRSGRLKAGGVTIGWERPWSRSGVIPVWTWACMVCSGVSFTLFEGDAVIKEYNELVERGIIIPDTSQKYTESLEEQAEEERKMQKVIADLLKEEAAAREKESVPGEGGPVESGPFESGLDEGGKSLESEEVTPLGKTEEKSGTSSEIESGGEEKTSSEDTEEEEEFGEDEFVIE